MTDVDAVHHDVPVGAKLDALPSRDFGFALKPKASMAHGAGGLSFAPASASADADADADAGALAFGFGAQ